MEQALGNPGNSFQGNSPKESQGDEWGSAEAAQAAGDSGSSPGGDQGTAGRVCHRAANTMEPLGKPEPAQETRGEGRARACPHREGSRGYRTRLQRKQDLGQVEEVWVSFLKLKLLE